MLSSLNYRPISITYIAYKILEHIMHSKVIRFKGKKKNFGHQNEFRTGHSCGNQLAGFVHDIHISIDSGSQVRAGFLQISKSFDRLPHQCLLHKLTNLRWDSSMVVWIKDWLPGRTKYTVVNSHSSSGIPVSSGVHQGSVLSTELLLLYINDLPSCVSLSIPIFVDYCVLSRQISSTLYYINLQGDLNKTSELCSFWLVMFNPSKWFSKQDPHFIHSDFIDSKSIESVYSY